jgi:hypothetical protein
VAEVMAHLPTWERKLLREAASLRRTPGASVTLPSEAEQEQAASRGRRLPPPGIVHDLVGARWETLTFLTGLTAQDLDRGGRDRGGMDLTVARILIIIAEHEDEQAARIERLRAELGLPTGQPAPRQAGLPVTQV